MAASPQHKKIKLEKTEDNVTGYIHDVSPVKTSARNTKYFNASFQTNHNEFHHSVVFSPEKHTSFVQAATNNTPVKICNITKKLSISLTIIFQYHTYHNYIIISLITTCRKH